MGEGNLCAKVGQNLLGTKQRSKEDSVQIESFSDLSRFSWGLKKISSFQFLNQNRLCLKKKSTILFYVSVESCVFFMAIFFETDIQLRLPAWGGGSFVISNRLR